MKMVVLERRTMKMIQKAIFKFYLRVFLVIGVFVWLDQVTKHWAIQNAFIPQVVIPQWLTFSLSHNSGSIWGIWQNASLVLACMGIFVVVCMLYGVHSQAISRFEIFCLGILLGGIIGNTIDRFRFGYVIDFIDLRLGDYHWPCFNVADIGISSVCVLFIVISLSKFFTKK